MDRREARPRGPRRRALPIPNISLGLPPSRVAPRFAAPPNFPCRRSLCSSASSATLRAQPLSHAAAAAAAAPPDPGRASQQTTRPTWTGRSRAARSLRFRRGGRQPPARCDSIFSTPSRLPTLRTKQAPRYWQHTTPFQPISAQRVSPPANRSASRTSLGTRRVASCRRGARAASPTALFLFSLPHFLRVSPDIPALGSEERGFAVRGLAPICIDFPCTPPGLFGPGVECAALH